MDNKLKNIDFDTLKNIVGKSFSNKEVTEKLGLNYNNKNIVKNVERKIRRNGISVEHFDGVIRIKESLTRYDKSKLEELVKKYDTLKDVLLEINLLPVGTNYNNLKKYLRKYDIDYSKFKNVRRNGNVKYTKEFLEDIIKKSNTIMEVIENIGLSKHGNNYRTIKKYIELYDLNISHFDANKIRNQKLTNFNTISLQEILIENSKYTSTNNLKNKLYNNGLKEKKCEICEQNEIWNGKHMSLILDHINGINNDNRIENLRIVCPNCNATLETHCRGKKVVERQKNKEKQKKENIKNSQLKRRKIMDRPNLETLKKEINEFGYCATGRKYKVSDNTIRKWINSYEKINI